MIKFRYLLVFCLAVAVSGCAGHKMALTKGQSEIDLTDNSIALLSVKLSNQNNPSYQLGLAGAIICPPSKKCTSGAVNLYPVSAPYRSEKDLFNEYLLSFELEAGTYNIETLSTGCNVTFFNTCGDIPLHLEAEIKPKSVIYLGHIDALLRKRKSDNEKQAGPCTYFTMWGPGFSLIASETVGYSSGTFDAVVEDRFDEDMKKFISEYPALQSVKVEKSILPQWIRPENRDRK